MHSDEQPHHSLRNIHCHGRVYYIDTTKIGFEVFLDIVWFLFYSFKVKIHLPCINTQGRRTAPFYLLFAIIPIEFTILILQKYNF